MKKLVIFLVLLCSTSLLQADDNIFPDANHPDTEGYRGVVWSSSLKDFKANHHSSTASVTPAETAAIADLLMNFHKPDSPYPAAKTDIEQMPGDKTDYVFYDSHFYLAALPVDVKRVETIKAFLASRYTPKELITRAIPGIKLDYQSYDNPFAGDEHMERDTSSRLYLASVFTLGPPHSKSLTAVLLIHISSNYFDSPHNAWAAYRSQSKTQPQPALSEAK